MRSEAGLAACKPLASWESTYALLEAVERETIGLEEAL